MKRCQKCRLELEHSHFGKDRSRHDGLHPVCRDCRPKYVDKRKQRIRSAEYKERHREQNRERGRAYYAKTGYKSTRARIASLRDSAKKRGLPFELPEMLAWDLVTDACYYCAAKTDRPNGIDRVDNTLGYVEGNVVTACRRCNVAKNDMSVAEFLAWVNRIAKRSLQCS